MLRARLEMSPAQWKRFYRLLELSEGNNDYFLVRRGTEFWMTERVVDLSSGELIAVAHCIEKMPPLRVGQVRIWFSVVRI
jgi:hypothetical protein